MNPSTHVHHKAALLAVASSGQEVDMGEALTTALLITLAVVGIPVLLFFARLLLAIWRLDKVGAWKTGAFIPADWFPERSLERRIVHMMAIDMPRDSKDRPDT